MPTKTVLFIHGNFVNYQCWDQWVARYEAKGYKCIAIPYPGRERNVAALRRAHPDPELGAITIDEVINYHVQIINDLDKKPIIIGHAFGGLLAQLMLNRGLAAAAIAINSVPPQGIRTLKFSSLRSTFPVFNPLNSAYEPFMMPFEQFQYAFVNCMSLDEQLQAYEDSIVPESLLLVRGGLSSKARVNFAKMHAPLLMIAGEIDNITPASLNKTNFKRYQAAPESIADFKEFPGRNHYNIIAGRGWEEVADYTLDWTIRQGV